MVTVYWPSKSAWSGLYTSMQLSCAFPMPSPSMSGSHSSPLPSPSVSSWLEFAILGQLSTLSWIPSLSCEWYWLLMSNINYVFLDYLSLKFELLSWHKYNIILKSHCTAYTCGLWQRFSFRGSRSPWGSPTIILGSPIHVGEKMFHLESYN